MSSKERAAHPEGDAFNEVFSRWLLANNASFTRSVLLDCREQLWETWKKLAIQFDAKGN
jgi:hypothetical protein